MPYIPILAKFVRLCSSFTLRPKWQDHAENAQHSIDWPGPFLEPQPHARETGTPMGKNIGKGLILGEVFDQIHKIAWFHCGAHDVDPNDRINITLTYMTTQAQKTLTIGKIPNHGNCRQWQGFKIWICKPRWTMTNPQTSKDINNQHQDIV